VAIVASTEAASLASTTYVDVAALPWTGLGANASELAINAALAKKTPLRLLCIVLHFID
jgi:hypothetical protein